MAVKDGLPSTDFSRMNREWVKSVADSAGGGLPDITEADEGKVLTVESGEAAWATAGGGGGETNVEIVILSYDDEADDGSYISNKTKQEILDLFNDGKVVIIGIGEEPAEYAFCTYLDMFGSISLWCSTFVEGTSGSDPGIQLTTYSMATNETTKWTVSTVFCQGTQV